MRAEVAHGGLARLRVHHLRRGDLGGTAPQGRRCTGAGCVGRRHRLYLQPKRLPQPRQLQRRLQRLLHSGLHCLLQPGNLRHLSNPLRRSRAKACHAELPRPALLGPVLSEMSSICGILTRQLRMKARGALVLQQVVTALWEWLSTAPLCCCERNVSCGLLAALQGILPW